MLHLSWNLSRNIKVSDPKLFHLIKYVSKHASLRFTNFVLLQKLLDENAKTMLYDTRVRETQRC